MSLTPLSTMNVELPLALIPTMREEFPLHIVAIFGLLALVTTGCSALPSPSDSADILVVPENTVTLSDCRELGLVDVVDGSFSLDRFCDCETYSYVKEGSLEGAMAKARAAARRRRANTLRVLETLTQTAHRTHLEECCRSSGFRVLALAYRCDQATMSWLRGVLTSP